MPRKHEEGKTLMELMVVMALAGIIMAMAMPNFLLLKSQADGRSMTQELASELRLARQLAMTRRERIRVVFDLEQQVVTAEYANRGTTYRSYGYASTGIRIDKPSGGTDILFHPSGRTATATTIQLRSRDGRVHKLTVGLTGKVSVL